MKRVCVVTGSRADYGLLRWVMEGIQASSELELQLVVTGMHLASEFGNTWREIEADGFSIDRKIDTLLSSDSPAGVTKSMGLGLIAFADALSELSPDMVLVLGDRSEIFVAAAAATVACIPIAHLHGGERTEGAIDESFRHSITKMSHLHFVAAEEYRRRVIQLGEDPDRVILVGGLGIDSILRLPLLSPGEVEESLGLTFSERNLLITFHPVTLEPAAAEGQMLELLSALEPLAETSLIFTMPNADTGGRQLIRMVEEFVGQHSNAFAFTSLGQLRYLSTIRNVDAVVGNSSSGLTEVPSFKKGTINIGTRQQGRLRASSVIDCDPDRRDIGAAMRRLYSSDFQAALLNTQNPYGNGGASDAIVKKIESVGIASLLRKSFVDLEAQSAHPA
jgi:GDP/UDP-N,N'-diacetylbacillosamine 2-epimerase (hydrolysing)